MAKLKQKSTNSLEESSTFTSAFVDFPVSFALAVICFAVKNMLTKLAVYFFAIGTVKLAVAAVAYIKGC